MDNPLETPEPFAAWLSIYADEATPCPPGQCPLASFLQATAGMRRPYVTDTGWGDASAEPWTRVQNAEPWHRRFVTLVDGDARPWNRIPARDLRRYLKGATRD